MKCLECDHEKDDHVEGHGLCLMDACHCPKFLAPVKEFPMRRDYSRCLGSFALAGIVILALASVTFAADPAPAAPAAPVKAKTYHQEIRCTGGQCMAVWVEDGATAGTCTCVNCPAGGGCTAGQCGQAGCGAQASYSSSSSSTGSGQRRRLFGRLFHRRAGGCGGC